MKRITSRIGHRALTIGMAGMTLAALPAVTELHAQPTASEQGSQAGSPTGDAPIVKRPPALSGASGAIGASNPDHMPIKRPNRPTPDPITHEPPASGANAK